MLKILILRFSSIGDIVLTTPVIRALKQQLPNAEIHYCTKEAFAILLENNPYLDKLFLLNKDKKTGVLIKELQQENYDYIVDLHHNLRTFIIKKRLGIKSFTFDKLNVKKWLYVNFKINILPAIHVVDRYMEAVKLLDVSNDGLGLEYFIPKQDEVATTQLPEAFRNGYAVFAIGAQHFTKRLPPERIVEFCEQIPFPIILLGGKEDMKNGEYIAERLAEKGSKMEVYNACGKYNLNESASIIRQAEKVFTHDTGLMHIAAAFKKEIYSIWGNTVPIFGMYPYLTRYHIIENNQLHCRPCSKIGYGKCPKGHFKCMNDLILPHL